MSGRTPRTDRPEAERPAPLALVSLVAANLVPLVGVGWLGWSVVEVMVLYWIESGVIGLFNVPRILLAQGAPEGWTNAATGVPARNTLGRRIGAAAFFCVHYGGFWLGHALLIVVAFGSQPLSDRAPSDAAFAVSVGALFLSHAASFALTYVGRGRYRTASPGLQMWRPYPRVVVLHLGALGGGALLARFGAPVAGVAVLVVLKTAADATLYLLGYGRTPGGVTERALPSRGGR